MRDVRLGIQVDQLRSRLWRVRSGQRRPELFLEHEGLERAMHISLHESGKWHVKVDGSTVHSWARPDEIYPGYIRAVSLVQPPIVATFADIPASGVVLAQMTSDDAHAGRFTLFIERAGEDRATWPGEPRGTRLVARLPLAEEMGQCCIVFDRVLLPPGQATLSGSTDDLAAIQTRASEIRQAATVFAAEPDGTFLAIDLLVA